MYLFAMQILKFVYVSQRLWHSIWRRKKDFSLESWGHLNWYCEVRWGESKWEKRGRASERHEAFITDQKVIKLSANEQQKIKVEIKGNKNIEKEKTCLWQSSTGLRTVHNWPTVLNLRASYNIHHLQIHLISSVFTPNS